MKVVLLVVIIVYSVRGFQDCCADKSLEDKYFTCCNGEECCSKLSCCGTPGNEVCCKSYETCCQGNVCCDRQNCCGDSCCKESEQCILSKGKEELECCPFSRVCESPQRGEELVECCEMDEVCCSSIEFGGSSCCREGSCSDNGICCSEEEGKIACGSFERCCDSNEGEKCCRGVDKCCKVEEECCSSEVCCDRSSTKCSETINSEGKVYRKCISPKPRIQQEEEKEKNAMEDYFGHVSDDISFEILILPMSEGEGMVVKCRNNNNKMMMSDFSKEDGVNWKTKRIFNLISFWGEASTISKNTTSKDDLYTFFNDYEGQISSKNEENERIPENLDTIIMSYLQDYNFYSYLPKLLTTEDGKKSGVDKIYVSGNILENNGNINQFLLDNNQLVQEINKGEKIFYENNNNVIFECGEEMKLSLLGANLGVEKSMVYKIQQTIIDENNNRRNGFNFLSLNHLGYGDDDMTEFIEQMKSYGPKMVDVMKLPNYGEFQTGRRGQFVDNLEEFFRLFVPKSVVFSNGFPLRKDEGRPGPKCEWIKVLEKVIETEDFDGLGRKFDCFNRRREHVKMNDFFFKFYQTQTGKDGRNAVLVSVRKNGDYEVQEIGVPGRSILLSPKNQKSFDRWWKRKKETMRKKFMDDDDDDNPTSDEL